MRSTFGRRPESGNRSTGRLAEGPPSASPIEVATRAAVLRRLELDVTRRLDGMLSGDFVTALPGPGSETAGSRAYGPGDDARRIDWNLTARSLGAYVRTTDADRELETSVIVDRSPSLDFGTAVREKREVALGALAAFGFLTVRGGNRLGVTIAGGDSLVQFPPRAGRRALLGALSAVYETRRSNSSPGPGADLAAGLTRAERTQRRRGQIVVISDFLDKADWQRPLRRLAQRHGVVAVQVTDPREFDLPPVGLLSVVDAETGRRLHVQTDAPGLRERYRAAARQRQEETHRGIVGAGAAHLVLSTDRDWVLDIARHLGRRQITGLPGLHPRAMSMGNGAPA